MGQIWTKLAKINRFSNCFDNFSHFSGRDQRQFWTNFSHILWTKNHVLKKVGRTRAGDLFKFWYFLNLHALGYPKSVTKKFCEHFWVNKSLSMMCNLRHLAFLQIVNILRHDILWSIYNRLERYPCCIHIKI
jgi:hypothetical protein